MKTKTIMCTIIVLLLPTELSAFDAATHWYLGLNTTDVWLDYDPDFYACLNSSDDSTRIVTRKFYCIGLALPDIIDQQEGIRALINALYALRDESQHFIPLSAYYILDETHSQVQQSMTFNGPPPSNNLTKLREMADEARIVVPNPINRAVVYGALMHVIHDLYAHMVLQPSKFGYGHVYQSIHFVDDPLNVGEAYYELMTPTFIPDWHFVKDIVYQGFWYDNGQPTFNHPLDGLCWSSADLWHVYLPYQDEWGDWYVSVVDQGFQTRDFDAIQAFNYTAQRIGYGQNLGRERLEAYIHGAFVSFFPLYGYEAGGVNLGGLEGHPNWQWSDYLEFIKCIGEENYTLGGVLEVLYNIAMRPASVEVACFFVNKVLRFLQIYRRHNSPWFNFLDDIYDYPGTWYHYFESVRGLDSLRQVVPAGFQNEYFSEFEKWRDVVVDWENGTYKKPNLRSSYADELDRALAMKPHYLNTLMEGSSYFDATVDGHSKFKMMRKQGPWGGFLDVPDTTYGYQPAIIDMYFTQTEDPVWAELETPVPSAPLDLYASLFTMGKTRIRVWGKGFRGSMPPNMEICSEEITDPPGKYTLTLTFNATDATSNGVRETSFRTEAWSDIHSNYSRMQDSDYRTGYAEYGDYIPHWHEGRPWLLGCEDPIEDPLEYWPYVLRIVPLKRPVRVKCIENLPNQTRFCWKDSSNLEDGFIVARRRPEEQWNEEYATVSGSPGCAGNVEYSDTVTLAHKYWYRVKAIDNYDRCSRWSDSTDYVHCAIGESERPDVTAYNNGKKAVLVGNHLYITHAKDEWVNREVILLHSNDGGMTFEEILYTGGHASHPAIAADDDGNVYVVWGRLEHLNSPSGWYRRYHCHYYRDGTWTTDLVYNEYLYDSSETWHPPEDLIAAPSIACSPDSGYVAFKLANDVNIQNIRIARFPLENPSYGNYEIIENTWCNATEYVSIGYDKAKRLVIAVQTDEHNPLQLHYRKIGSDSWRELSISDEDCAHGSPALYAGTNELWVTAEADGDDGFGLHYYHIKWHKNNMVANDTAHNMAVEPDSLQQNELLKDTRFGEYYYVSSFERIDDCDYDTSGGTVGYSSLVSPNEVLYQKNGDIIYRRRDSTGWTTPNNLSNTTKASSFPQGIPIQGQGGVPQLLVFWTENVDHADEFYMIRNILDRPGVPDPPDGGPQSDYTETVKVFSFDNIYPNPSNRVLKLNFTSPDTRTVIIKLYDVAGRLADRVCEQQTHIGINSIAIPTNEYAAGVYFVRIQAGSFETVKKVTLFK